MDDRGEQIEASSLWRILEVTRELGVVTDLALLLEHVVDATLNVLRADRASVFLYDKARHELYSQVATGTDGLRFSANHGIAGQCVAGRQVINVPDCYADERFNQAIDRQTGYRTRCLLAVPLIGHDDSLVGVMQVLNKKQGVFTQDDERLARVLASQCAVALQRARLLEETIVKEKMERDLALARAIQQKVLPTVMPRFTGYDVAGMSRPAEQTGGDIYDVIQIDEFTALLLLGDATGHGIGPALSVTQVRAMLRIAVRLDADFDATFSHINDQLCEDLSDDRFVTAMLARLDAQSHRIAMHAGGQGPLLHFHAATGLCEWLSATCLPMGIVSGVPLAPPRVIELAPGDIFGAITDGVFEYKNPDRKLFGLERTGEVIAAHHDGSMRDLIERLWTKVRRFGDGADQDDDVTMLFVRRCG